MRRGNHTSECPFAYRMNRMTWLALDGRPDMRKRIPTDIILGDLAPYSYSLSKASFRTSKK